VATVVIAKSERAINMPLYKSIVEEAGVPVAEAV
jgi:hypothetical protein